MTTTPFSWEIVSEGDGALIVLHGDVNSAAAPGFDAAYAEVAPMPGRITLDFTDTDFINSTGIALIVSLLAKARAVHRPVAARGLSDHYREIFRITRLSDFLTIEDTNAGIAT
jgi:anti-anti-sigma factor